jgi:NAD(P)-dependent dehydrogenase (short-subunit alcohol dehydrogenase family)
MHKVIIVTGAANSIGRSTCRKLAQAGHTVYVSLREADDHDEHGGAEAGAEGGKHGADLRTIAFDVSSEASVNSLPQLRKQGHGLLIWVSSSSARGGSVPFLGAYASSKAALDALALGYAGELARWGVETTIVVPSALGPGHYIRSGRPLDTVRAEEYADGPTADLSEIALSALAQLPAKDRTPQDVATAIADIVDMPFGQRPLRVHFGPDDDGAAAVGAVADGARAELLRRIGLEDILKPAFIG